LLIISRNKNDVEQIEHTLKKNFKMKDLGKVSKFLGINIKVTGTEIKFLLKDYINKILKEFNMAECSAVKTTMAPGEKLNDTSSPLCNATQYRSIVGKLIFASNTVRFDISYAVSTLSRYLREPTENQLRAAKRVLRYLKDTSDFGITYKSGTELKLDGYSNTDWAGDPIDRKSTAGYVFKVANGPITWKSKRLPTIALSSTESEYMGLAHCIKEILWIQQVFRELNPDLPIPNICEDNNGAIQLIQHPAHHERTKHINIMFHFIRNVLQQGKLKIQRVDTKSQLADIFVQVLL